MPVPLLPIVAAGVTGLAGLSFASVLGDGDSDDSPPTAPPTNTNPDSGADSGGFNVSLLAQIAGFIALLVFGRTVLQEIL